MIFDRGLRQARELHFHVLSAKRVLYMAQVCRCAWRAGSEELAKEICNRENACKDRMDDLSAVFAAIGVAK